MTTGQPTPHVTKTLTAGEMESLADRLLSRGVSKMFTGQPQMQADMRIASQVLRGLLSKLDKAAGSVAEAARLLAEVGIEVEG